MTAADSSISGEVIRQPDAQTRTMSGWHEVVVAGLTVLSGAALLVAMVWGYRSTMTPVMVSIDEFAAPVGSHLATVGDLLTELGVALQPEDRLSPPLDAALSPGVRVEIQRARPLLVQDGGGGQRLLRTHAAGLQEALAEAGISVGPHDQVLLEGEPVAVDVALPPLVVDHQPSLPGVLAALPWDGADHRAVEVSIRRALPLVLEWNGSQSTIWTTATTVGEALGEVGLALYEEDRLIPGLGTPMRAGMVVSLERSAPVVIRTKHNVLETRSRSATVADLLAEQGLLLTGQDRVEPSLDTLVTPEMEVRVTRVERAFEVHEDVTPYASVWEADPELEIDNRRLDQEGVNGITRLRYQVVLEDGEPISRTLQETWLAQQPITRVLKYGSNIVLREVETPDGPRTYWRKIRMFATSYSAAEAGVPKDSPYYGRTRLGTPVGFGKAAVDPRVVTLGSDVFVPGYGIASADDTGGAVKGKWIDLAYDDGELVHWSRCVDVYLIGSPPPSYQISYLLPSWPQAACLR